MAPAIRGMGSVFTETVMALEGWQPSLRMTAPSKCGNLSPRITTQLRVPSSKVEFEAPEMKLLRCDVHGSGAAEAAAVNLPPRDADRR